MAVTLTPFPGAKTASPATAAPSTSGVRLSPFPTKPTAPAAAPKPTVPDYTQAPATVNGHVNSPVFKDYVAPLPKNETISAPAPEKTGFFHNALKVIEEAVQGVRDAVKRGERTPDDAPASERVASTLQLVTSAVNLSALPFTVPLEGLANANIPQPQSAVGKILTAPLLAPLEGAKTAAGALNSVFSLVPMAAAKISEQPWIPQEWKESVNLGVNLAGMLAVGKVIHEGTKVPGRISEFREGTLNTNAVVESAASILNLKPEKNVVGQIKPFEPSSVKDAYLDLARRTHPDKGGSSQAFGIVNTAKTLLEDYSTLPRKEFNAKYQSGLDGFAYVTKQITDGKNPETLPPSLARKQVELSAGHPASDAALIAPNMAALDHFYATEARNIATIGDIANVKLVRYEDGTYGFSYRITTKTNGIVSDFNSNPVSKTAAEAIARAKEEVAAYAQKQLASNPTGPQASDFAKIAEQVSKIVPEARAVALQPVSPSETALRAKNVAKPAAEAVSKPQEPVPSTREAQIEAKLNSILAEFKQRRTTKANAERRAKEAKGMALEFAALKRSISGNVTATELKNALNYLESNHVGKKVTVDGREGTIDGPPSFGRFPVKFQDGNIVRVARDRISAPKATEADATAYLREKGINKALGQISLRDKTFKLAEPTTVRVGAAPYRGVSFSGYKELVGEFSKPEFDAFEKSIRETARASGVSVEASSDAGGGWMDTDLNKSVFEPSKRIEITGSIEDAVRFAARLGQEFNQQGMYVFERSETGPDYEYTLKFSDREQAFDVASRHAEFGFEGISFTPDDATIHIGDMGGEHFEALTKLLEYAKNEGYNILSSEADSGALQFINQDQYAGITGQSQKAGVQGEPVSAQPDSGGVPAQRVAVSEPGAVGRGGNEGALQKPDEKPLRRANPVAQRAAQKYATENGFGRLPSIDQKSVRVNPERARRIADAYDSLPVDDSANPEVAAAYKALGEEVQKQFDALPVNVEWWTEDGTPNSPQKPGQPYQNSAEMMSDVRDNNNLKVFLGGEPHPFLDAKDANGVSLNDKLRAVHDYFGHAAEGYQFGANGEEAAWLKHSLMFSEEAQRALTTETRGQNSWVNFFGDHQSVPAAQREYARQKVALLPKEFSDAAAVLEEIGVSRETAQAKASKVGSSISAKSIEQGLASAFGETAQYTPVKIKEQAAMAERLISSDIERAKRVVLGEERLPDNMLAGTIIKAMEDYALAIGDSGLALEIANSPLTAETSVHAQEMRLLAERNPDSAVAMIQEVKKAREAKDGEQAKKGPSKSETIDEIKSEVKKTAPTRDTWETFLEEIKCK